MSFLCSFIYAQQIYLDTYATGFTNPVNLENAGDDRLFVVEQAGVIKIINPDRSVNETPFLDINPKVSNSGGERGLLGIAFHPNFATNGYFYLNYIDNNGNTIISRFTVSSTNQNIADPASELQILTYDQPFANHNGGDMTFGPDGYLYIASGDGGDGGDPGDRAQSLNTLLGKMLRIDVNNSSNGNNYAIPADNPFAGSTTAMREIWAYGLRNPWKFSFDKLTNDLWIADVGQSIREEINMVPSTSAGLNYGWRCYEGNSVYNESGNCPNISSLTFPIAQYTHNGNGLFKCSITGGYRYRGTEQPSFVGLYFFADYCSNEIGMLTPTGSSWTMSFSAPFEGNGWTTFGEDNNGELYIAGIDSGSVYKLLDLPLSVNEKHIFNVSLSPNPSTNDITITALNYNTIAFVKIYDVQGKLVLSNTEFNTEMIQISTKDLTTGVYFVEISNSEGSKLIKKLIKN